MCSSLCSKSILLVFRELKNNHVTMLIFIFRYLYFYKHSTFNGTNILRNLFAVTFFLPQCNWKKTQWKATNTSILINKKPHQYQHMSYHSGGFIFSTINKPTLKCHNYLRSTLHVTLNTLRAKSCVFEHIHANSKYMNFSAPKPLSALLQFQLY